MSRQVDFNDMSEDDIEYVRQRPRLQEEMRLQGMDFAKIAAGGSEPEPEDGDDEDEVDYTDWTKAQLQEEIDRRNEDRDEEDQIVPESNKNDDLAAALFEDDENSENE